MIIYWNTFEHCTGGKSTSILCQPSGSHHRHPQQRNSAQTFPPITQQPPLSVARFCSPFCLVFFSNYGTFLRVHPEILSGFPQEHRPAWRPRAASLKELSQQGSYSAFLLPSPKFCWKGLWLCTLICGSTSAAQVLIWHPAPTSSIFLTNSAHKTSTFRISLKYTLDNI